MLRSCYKALSFSLVTTIVTAVPFGTALTLGVSTTVVASPKKAESNKVAQLPDARQLLTLGPIDGESDAKLTVINLRFDKKPHWKSVRELQDHGSFLQLILPDTVVPEPGKFIDGNSPFVPKIAVLQLTASDAGVRFFVNQNAAKTKDAVSAEILDKRIILTVDHTALKKNLAAIATTETAGQVDARQEAVQVKSSVSAEDVIARTEVRHDIPAPSDIVKTEASNDKVFGPPRQGEAVGKVLEAQLPIDDGPATSTLGSAGFDFREKLVQVAIFSGCMLVFLLMVMLFKPVLRKRKRGGGDEGAIDMRMLGSLPLAARQKLSLIQVGDEKILIGITPENVSFIATIGAATGGDAALRQARPEPFSGLLQQPGLIDMQKPPRLKDIPGNDADSLREGGAVEQSRSYATRERIDGAKVGTPLLEKSTPEKPDTSVRSTPKSPSANKQTSTPARVAGASGLGGGTPAGAVRKPVASRINIAVGEDGIKDLRPKAAMANGSMKGDAPASAKGIEDVTQLIREKLKNLRTI